MVKKMVFRDLGKQDFPYCYFIISLYAIVFIIGMQMTVGLQSEWHIVCTPLVEEYPERSHPRQTHVLNVMCTFKSHLSNNLNVCLYAYQNWSLSLPYHALRNAWADP